MTKTNSCHPYPTPPAINNDKNPILPQISQSVYFFNYISFDFNSWPYASTEKNPNGNNICTNNEGNLQGILSKGNVNVTLSFYWLNKGQVKSNVPSVTRWFSLKFEIWVFPIFFYSTCKCIETVNLLFFFLKWCTGSCTRTKIIYKKNGFSISVNNRYLKIPSVLIGSLSASYLYLLIYLFA